MSEPPQTPDIDAPTPPAGASSAEDRKAASALAALDSTALEDSSSAGTAGNAAAVRAAMARLEGKPTTKQAGKGVVVPAAPLTKAVKIEQADIALVVDQLEMSKPKATELLRANGGDVVKALQAYLVPA